jgi:tRNA pseudouridine32 synthase / 23S rRNA pseudouridine746 synthase
MDLLHLDDHLLVLDKPAGLPVLPDGWQPDAPYLVRLLEEQVGRIWIVHRLDKTTSGVMVFARTAEAHRRLNAQFERREVVKIYHAIVEGIPVWERRTARHALRLNVGKKHRTVVDHGRGKPAETHFCRLQAARSHALLEARPGTGRTHQVRVHAAALGHPLLADQLYGASPSDLITRPALHALSFTISHPESGQAITFNAPYPQDFASALKRLRL